MEWSYLPDDLLREIARKFVLISDFVRFRVVCKSWRSAVQLVDLPPQQPWVMPYSKKIDITNCCFYNIDAETVDGLHLPEFHNKIFCGGSCDGWLVLVDENKGDAQALSLLQPLTRSHISLPLLENGIPVSQAHLSCSPTSGRCTVVAWNHRLTDELYSCKLGPDGRWSQWTVIPSQTKYVRSVVVSRDHQNIYAMNLFQISHFDLKNKTSRVIQLPYVRQQFLVEASSGELLLAVDFSSGPRFGPFTYTLEFYRLEDEGWMKLQGSSIDNDRVFYLSACQSFSSDVGHVDHVYLASGSLIKMFNLKDGSCSTKRIPQHIAGYQSERCPHSTWFFPSLCP